MKNNSQNIKKTILRFSAKKFVNEGILDTSMDRIANEMRISKKTVYKYFKNKDELVHEIVCDLIEQSKKEIDIIIKSNLSDFNIFINLIDYISYGYFKFYKCFLPDLELKYQNIYKEKYLPHKKETILILIRIIKKCQSQKIFIDFPPELFAESYLSLLQRFNNSENDDTIMENLDALNVFSFVYINALLNHSLKSKYHKIAKTKILLKFNL